MAEKAPPPQPNFIIHHSSFDIRYEPLPGKGQAW
jgi:hypothetical protein